MLFRVSGDDLEVPVERVHAGLSIYDEWLRGQNGAPITRRERLLKVESIAFQLAPRQWIENDLLKIDYYAPMRLKRVLLSELGKRNRKPKKKQSKTAQRTLF